MVSVYQPVTQHPQRPGSLSANPNAIASLQVPTQDELMLIFQHRQGNPQLHRGGGGLKRPEFRGARPASQHIATPRPSEHCEQKPKFRSRGISDTHIHP